MKIYEIRGAAGLVMFVLGVLATLAIVVALPASFMMVLWNAIVFEGFRGPQIGLVQGLLLWFAGIILFKLIFNPQVVFEFQKFDDEDGDNPSSGKGPKDSHHLR